MKFNLLIAALVLALPAQAAVFKSSVTSDQVGGNVLVFFVPGKTPQLINPKTGETGTLPAINAPGKKNVDLPPAN